MPDPRPDDPQPARPLDAAPDAAVAREQDLPPVVARMVIEVRSDGVRTMARGALEDLATGQQVAVETPALTPLELSLALSRSLLSLPGLNLARGALHSLSPRRLARRLLGRSDPDDAGRA